VAFVHDRPKARLDAPRLDREEKLPAILRRAGSSGSTPADRRLLQLVHFARQRAGGLLQLRPAAHARLVSWTEASSRRCCAACAFHAARFSASSAAAVRLVA